MMENRAGMMNLLSLFCKLLTIKAIKLTKAADVFKYYAKVVIIALLHSQPENVKICLIFFCLGSS